MNLARRQSLVLTAVVVVLLPGVLAVASQTALGLAHFRDFGFPDSATLLKLGEFVRSGQLYPPIDQPPYYVTVYGPLTYVLLAGPYALAEMVGVAPPLAVRLSIVIAWLAAVLLIYRIARRVYGRDGIPWLTALFALAASPLAVWTTQVRGDLVALAFSLLSLYITLVANGRTATIGAAVCIGVALLTKQTYVAAPAAIVLWLLYMRRFQDALLTTVCAIAVVAAGYGFMWWREPLMLTHLAALNDPVWEVRGAIDIVRAAVALPVVPLALAGALFTIRRVEPRRLLLLAYCVASWLVAMLTISHVGGNINYFWEPLFASSVLAGFGLRGLLVRVETMKALATAAVIPVLWWASLGTLAHDLYTLRGSYWEVVQYKERKRQWEALVSAISGRRLLSTVPDVTSHSSVPEMLDPYMIGWLDAAHRWNAAPIVSKIEDGTYDLIIVHQDEVTRHGTAYRGVRFWSDPIWSAVSKSYYEVCEVGDLEIWRPRRNVKAATGATTASESGNGRSLPKGPFAECQAAKPH